MENDKQFLELVRRFDKLEATLLERQRYIDQEIVTIRKDIDRMEIRLRDVEITQAKLLAIVAGGGGIGGLTAGIMLTVGKALGWY